MIEARRPDIARIEKRKKIIDVAILGDQTVVLKDKAKVAKYQDLRMLLQK